MAVINPVFLFVAIASLAYGALAFDLAEITPLKPGVMVSKSIACFTDLLYRGFGIRPYKCPEGFQKDGQMCFKRCNFGYSGDGDKCVMNCPPGFSTTGEFCTNMWAKGCCCIGCCSACPDGSIDIGCFCAQSIPRHSYPRGPSTNFLCTEGQEYFEGLCYPTCPVGYFGMGPMCWGTNHEMFAYKCTEFFYTTEETICLMVRKELSFLEGGLQNGCLAALLGSTVMLVLPMEGAARICKSNILNGVNAINTIMQITNAQICNPVSSSLCLMHTSNIGSIECVTVTGGATQKITGSIGATQSSTETITATQSFTETITATLKKESDMSASVNKEIESRAGYRTVFDEDNIDF